MFPFILKLLLFSYAGVIQDPCLFWRRKQNKKSHPESPIPREEFPKKSKILLLCFLSALPASTQHSATEKSRAVWRRRCAQSHEGAGVGRDATSSQSLSAQKKDRNWQNAEARQSSKPTWRKKGLQTQTMNKRDGFYFTECQKKSGSPIEKANLELTSMTKIPHSIATDQGKSWQEGRRGSQEEARKTEACRWDIGFNEEGPRSRTVWEWSLHIIDLCEQASPADVEAGELSLTLGRLVELEPWYIK